MKISSRLVLLFLFVSGFLVTGLFLLTGATAREETAFMSGLDKITARVTPLQVTVGEPVRFGSLEIHVHSCFKKPPEEPPETVAFVEVFDRGLKERAAQDPEQPTQALSSEQQPEQPPGNRIFSGWMFASSPGLNAIEHPVYDAWLTDCRISDAETSAGSE